MVVYTAQPRSRPAARWACSPAGRRHWGQAEAASAADGPDRHRQSRSQILVTAPASPIMAPWSCCIPVSPRPTIVHW